MEELNDLISKQDNSNQKKMIDIFKETKMDTVAIRKKFNPLDFKKKGEMQ